MFPECIQNLVFAIQMALSFNCLSKSPRSVAEQANTSTTCSTHPFKPWLGYLLLQDLNPLAMSICAARWNVCLQGSIKGTLEQTRRTYFFKKNLYFIQIFILYKFLFIQSKCELLNVSAGETAGTGRAQGAPNMAAAPSGVPSASRPSPHPPRPPRARVRMRATPQRLKEMSGAGRK